MRTSLLICAALSALSIPLSRAEAARKVVLAVMDGVTWEDYLEADAPGLAQIIRQAAVGLMNTRSAGRPTREAAYLTLGAGARAAADMSAEQAAWCGSQDDEALRKLAGSFQSRTLVPLPSGAVGCWAAPALRTENSLQPYAAVPGLLGQTLCDAGKQVACLGNADTASAPRRMAALIAMGGLGLIRTGCVGKQMTVPDPDSPAGLRTNFKELRGRFDHTLRLADFIVVELGDTGRLAAVGKWLAPPAYAAQRRRAIVEADAFLKHVAAALRKQDGLLLIVTPAPPEDPAGQGICLTPIILWGQGIRGGLVTSASTRTPGLVTNMDVAPTVLHWLGVNIPEGISGRPITAIPVSPREKVRRTLMFHVKQRALDNLRTPVLHTMAYCMAGLLVLAGLAALLGSRAPAWLCGVAVGGLVAAMALVPAIIVAPILRPQTAAGAGASICIFFTVLAALSVLVLLRRKDLPAALWGIAAGIIMADVVLGGRLMRESLLGYSAALGARFYGIGNECGGVALAGSAAVAMAVIRRREALFRRLVAAAGLLAVCLIVGHPALGANLGMAAATAVCFGAVLYLAWPIRRRRLAATLVAAAVVTVVAAVILADLTRLGAAQSHVGRAFQGGSAALLQVAARKIGKNFLLLRNSPWTWPLVAGASVLIALVLAQPERLQAALNRRRLLGATTAAIAAGSAAALALNDSGVVPAALSLFFASAAVCYWVISERD